MAFPFLSHCNFEDGTKGHFDSETDTGNRLDIVHYSDLARFPGLPAPWRGAYACRVDLAKSANDAYLQEDTSWDLSASGTIAFRFMLWVSKDLVMADTDEFVVLVLQSAGPVSEVVCAINYTTANGLRIGVGETAASQFLPLPQGRWVNVEVVATIDSGAGNDGTINLYVDGSAATQVTALDQAAITQGRFGVIGQDAGTTAGTIIFDHIIADDARVYPTEPGQRFADNQVLLAAGQHLFVGPGCLENISLITGGTDNVLQCWDTDTANTNDVNRRKVDLRTSTAKEIVDPAGMPIKFLRGCYITLSGTAAAEGPTAIAKLGSVSYWGGDGPIKNYGLKRKALNQNV
ncbi:MAG TPA: hypothetical protein VIU43_01225 [Nitrosospira sp.]